MRSSLWIVVLLAGLCFAQDAAGPQVGDQALELECSSWLNTPADEDGNPTPVTLEELAAEGRVVVVEGWAIWCGPCKRVIPHLIEMHNKFKDSDKLAIVSIHSANIGRGKTVADVEAFVKEWGMPYAIGVDSGATLRKYGVRGIPHALVFNSSLELVWRGHPASPEFQSTVEAELAKLGDTAPEED